MVLAASLCGFWGTIIKTSRVKVGETYIDVDLSDTVDKVVHGAVLGNISAVGSH